MNKQWLMNQVNSDSEEFSQIEAVRRLGPYIDDTEVLDSLCRAAVETDNRRVREILISTLKNNQDEVNRRFSQIAIHAENPTHRRWALINLSLMECGNAKKSRHERIARPASIGSHRSGVQCRPVF